MKNLLKLGNSVIKVQKTKVFRSTSTSFRNCRVLTTRYLDNKQESGISITTRNYCIPKIDPIATALIDLVTFETVCSETLEALCDYFEEIIEDSSNLKYADVTFGDGVLNVKLGNPHGTYVINRQTPNRQIWFSSPLSGPKRYDFVPSNANPKTGYWYYKHDGSTLHETLQKEMSAIFTQQLDFANLPHGSRV